MCSRAPVRAQRRRHLGTGRTSSTGWDQELVGTPLKLSPGGAIPQISKAWEQSPGDMPSREESVRVSGRQ